MYVIGLKLVPLHMHCPANAQYRFTGTVPLELLSLPRLLTLEADQNSFTGSLVVPQQLVAMDSNSNYPEDYIYTGLNVNHNKVGWTLRWTRSTKERWSSNWLWCLQARAWPP